MKEYAIFYILLVILIVLFIFVVLLYSDYHSRIIVPSLASGNYRLSATTDTFSTLSLLNNTSTENGSLLFGDGSGDITNYSELTFVPIGGDEARNITGNIILLLGSNQTDGTNLTFQVVDDGQVISDPSTFFISNLTNWGLTVVRLKFRASTLENARHAITVETKTDNGTTVNDLVLNSAYVSYY